MLKIFFFFLVFTFSFQPFSTPSFAEGTETITAPATSSRRDIFLKRLVNAAKGKTSPETIATNNPEKTSVDNKTKIISNAEKSANTLKQTPQNIKNNTSVSIDEELAKLRNEIELLKSGKIDDISVDLDKAIDITDDSLTKNQKKASKNAVQELQKELAEFQGESVSKTNKKATLKEGLSSIKNELSSIKNELSRTGDLKGFFVQAGAYENRKSALGVVENLVQFGRTFISPIIKDGALLYRVRVGSLADKKIAESVRLDIAKAGYADARIIESK